MKYLIPSIFLFLGVKTYCQTPIKVNNEVAFAIVQNVPLYDGCDESMHNEEKKKCMSDRLTTLVNENFDKSIANNPQITEGIVRINVTFKIDEEGNVIDVIANAAYPELEAEAIRVIKLIPKMKAGTQLGKPVIVPYTLPILFKVEKDVLVADYQSFPVYRGCDENSSYEFLRECTTERIKDFIKVNSILDEADKLFPTERSTQFQANFVIDRKGKIKDIKVNAQNREMAILVIYALKQLPKMKAPGTINGKPTDVPFKFLMTIYFD